MKLNISLSAELPEIEKCIKLIRKHANTKLIGSVRKGRLETADELEEQLDTLKKKYDPAFAATVLHAARYTAGV